MPEETVLLTGISGFIAKHCAVELLQQGYRVRGTVRSLDKADAVRATLARHADVSRLEFVAADLLADAGWREAAAGVQGVLHVASPFPLAPPKNADDLIRPAVDGTLRVLRAAAAAGAARFVQTSSVVAVVHGHGPARPATFTEADWTDPDHPDVSAYARSKTLAERAARAFVADEGRALHYCSVNPGFVLGPLLDRVSGSSADLVASLLRGKVPGCPRVMFAVVDVRDVAKAHRLALQTAEPSGGRYLAVSETVWFRELAAAIKTRLGPRARKVSTRELPDFLVKLVALVDPSARSIVPDLGRVLRVDNTATRRALGMAFIGLADAAPAMADSLFEHGVL